MFEALDVPVGVYHVAVSKPGYAATWMGPTTIDQHGIPLDVDADQRSDLALQLRRGGVITGTVSDDAGDPVSNAWVVADGPGVADSPAQPFSGTVSADSHGRYRIYGLGAGEYVVSAMPGNSTQSVMAGNRLTRLRTTFWPGTTERRNARTVAVSEG
jgi:protocatechuate 3,4-dioxygenase beta subunit